MPRSAGAASGSSRSASAPSMSQTTSARRPAYAAKSAGANRPPTRSRAETPFAAASARQRRCASSSVSCATSVTPGSMRASPTA